eukprot:5424354-Lingulodinium_polyedra.AAC.1
MPNLEDLVNSPPFTIFPEFVEMVGLSPQRSCGPVILSGVSRGLRRAGEGEQRGAFFSEAAVPQVIPLGLAQDEHFAEAQRVAVEEPFPFNVGPVIDDDLRSAARAMACRCGDLHGAREEWYRPVDSLARRLWP